MQALLKWVQDKAAPEGAHAGPAQLREAGELLRLLPDLLLGAAPPETQEAQALRSDVRV